MANRYWVGGTDTWDATAGTKWALTSGGAGGEAVPTSSDDVFFDANSGAVTVTIGSTVNCLGLTCTGFTGTFSGTTSTIINCFGNFVLGSGMTWNGPTIDFRATGTLTSNGVSILGTINCRGGTRTLQDELVVTGTPRSINCGAGSLDSNNYNITTPSFRATGTGKRSLTLGSSTMYLTEASTLLFYTNSTAGNFSLNAGTSTIICNNTTNTALGFNIAFALTFNKVSFQRGASTGNITIDGSCTFAELEDLGTANHSFRFVAGFTTTFSSAAGFKIAGSASHTVTLTSTTASQHTLSCASGTITASYLNIANSKATGGAMWRADSTCVNGGGNAGWSFASDFFQIL